MLTHSIIMTINERDTSRPLSILFRPFTNSVRDTKYHKWCKGKTMQPTIVKAWSINIGLEGKVGAGEGKVLLQQS